MSLPSESQTDEPNPGFDGTAAPARKARFATRHFLLFGLLSATASGLVAQAASSPETETEPGVPVTDPLTKAKCGACHAPDAKGNLSRISWLRTTPEGWSQAIKRMVKLNGLQITAEESRSVVRYLSASHGLAPEEAKPVMYMPEHRAIEETNIPNETVRAACAACHAFGQPLSWRRSSHEWKLLQDFHVALYSQAEVQYRRPVDERGMPQPASAAKGPTPGEVALEYMRKNAPLHSPEWANWSARLRDPKLAGKWLVSASAPGKGKFFGTMTIAPGAAGGEFTTTTSLQSLADGSTLSRSGHGIVYGGYAWRGRSDAGKDGDAAAPDALTHDLRETMWISPDQKSGFGRWFWGYYQEFGFDVQLTRATGAPVIAAVGPAALKTGTKGVEVRIFGDSLPTGLTAADIDLGAGIKVSKLVSASATQVVATVDVAADATVGKHDVGIHGAVLENAIPVYAKVSYIKVGPETSLARLGGSPKHPKGYQQFVATGYDNGPDGKPNTADDVAVGPVDVTWSLDEFQARFDDDDTRFVGTIDQNGLFNPSIDGPNPQRRFGSNNYGDVWAVATAKSLTGDDGKPLTGRSYLVVTVPAYKRWDQPEVSK